MTETASDTICALASGTLPSAIALVRISGPAVQAIAASLFPAGLPRPRIATLAAITDPGGTTLDQGLATFFPAPRSYTGEDMLEVSLHGGPAIVSSVLDTITGIDGVRLADRGEFTRRAFEAGKLDLTAAEAVADLIDAETPGQRDQALAQLGGSLKGTYLDWRKTLLEILALVEVAIDFPDEGDAPTQTDGPVSERLERLESELTAALAPEAVGESIRDGFRIALIGAPNAGKSSLLNRLAGRDVAIVTDVPGTTRDVIEVRLQLAGHLVRVMDTAGLRDTDDPIEMEGMKRALSTAKDAEMTVLVLDGTSHTSSQSDPASLQPDITVLNKSDRDDWSDRDVSRETLPISAKTGDGLDRLINAIETQIETRTSAAPAALVTRARHRSGLAAARTHFSAAVAALNAGQGPEFAAEDIRRAVQELSGLMGQIDVEDVLGAVFSEFCIGK
ncbi:MAG: tRNA uridine-5-carboxymethylaminomethyl(34) synthesis GTPase MnmE [Pseudomonadota bacterium]